MLKTMLYTGDTNLLEIHLYDSDKKPLDLTDLAEAYVYIQRGTEILKRQCEVKEPRNSGVIFYKFTEEDLVLGDIDYIFQPVLIFNDGTHITGSSDIERVYLSLKKKAGEI